ncbi:P-II family nitrogen regulator [Paenibacillus mesotrionivorans]|uniref:P-II family nitrogen regulator n=1 Tax=Paenibacillus mesotrionivorans TaxID=3160968 RepID=A0ACC7NUF0_9BACL
MGERQTKRDCRRGQGDLGHGVAAAFPGTGMKYIPKRLLNLIVQDEDVNLVVNTLMKINRTGQVGDGRIFICPIEDALRVRTGETGIRAII